MYLLFPIVLLAVSFSAALVAGGDLFVGMSGPCNILGLLVNIVPKAIRISHLFSMYHAIREPSENDRYEIPHSEDHAGSLLGPLLRSEGVLRLYTLEQFFQSHRRCAIHKLHRFSDLLAQLVHHQEPRNIVLYDLVGALGRQKDA